MRAGASTTLNCKIKFKNHKWPELDVKSGTNLMATLLKSKIPVASSCHGDGVCGKCKMFVEPAGAASAGEAETLARNQASTGERLSCQFAITSDIEVDTSYW
jgi:ferredoxin, 2Fe-2S